MRKSSKARPKRGRIIPLLLTGGIGYVLGAWHMSAWREPDHVSAAAARAVAVRFPADWTNPQPAATPAETSRSAATAALFNPVALAPQPLQPAQVTLQQSDAENAPMQLFDPHASDPHGMVQTASLESVALPTASATHPATEPARPSANTAKPAKTTAAATRAPATNRSPYLLDDAQIASIKTRLHLTPDQEQMWPAVEAALRNIAYRRTQLAREGGAGNVQSLDPDAVQGLRTAAVPLIMSFNEEQKEEVRNLAHVVGLDQLASQF
ncbi:MAG TPA: hypothetical protein VF778_11055 [Xanthobacteraceae bacterium]